MVTEKEIIAFRERTGTSYEVMIFSSLDVEVFSVEEILDANIDSNGFEFFKKFIEELAGEPVGTVYYIDAGTAGIERYIRVQ